MRKFLLAALAFGSVASFVPAQAAESCYDLWGSRNAIYKNAGYCFKTARAIKEFGNAGCQYDDMARVPLSRQERADVAEYQRLERAMHCPR